jgi:trimethylamine corrinoid protein
MAPYYFCGKTVMEYAHMPPEAGHAPSRSAEREQLDLGAIITAYNDAIIDTDRDRALQIVRDAEAAGLSPQDVIFKLVIPAIERMMAEVPKDPDANLAQHFLTSRIGDQVVEEMLAKLEAPLKPVGRVVIGTAPGDLHALGKTIVGGCLKALMYEVIDLGSSVPAERFVDEAVARDAQVIGVSAMMMHTARAENGAIGVRRLLKERDLEGRIKLVVGGAPFRFDPDLYKMVGADGWAPDGITAGKMIGGLIRRQEAAA